MKLHTCRDADTVPGRVCKIVEALGDGDGARGVAAAAALTAKSAGTVRAWMDPGRGVEPGLSAALALDVAYWKATGLEPPLMALYEDRVSAETQGAHGSAKLNLYRELAGLHIDTARVPAEVMAATHPDGPGGAVITPGELHQITHAGDRARTAVDRVVAAARQVSGAGGRTDGGA